MRHCLTPSACGGADRIEELEAALRRIVDWADAYPLQVFPEVTEEYARRAHEVLTAKGMTLDRLAANAMRHCLTGVRRIASSALAEPD
jgi:hypothetical protein